MAYKTRSKSLNDVDREPALAGFLRTLVLAFALSAFAWDITTFVGQGAIWLATLSAGYLARRTARTDWPLWRTWAVAMLLAAVASLASLIFTASSLTSFFNPAAQLNFSEFLTVGSGVFALVWALRTTTARKQGFVALELGIVGASLASSLAMHRDGAINRPMALGDLAWSMGEDPAKFIIYGGCIATVVMLLTLFREKKLYRTVIHLAVLGLISAAVFAFSPPLELPKPEPKEEEAVTWKADEPWLDPDLKPHWGDPDRSDPGTSKGQGKEGDEGRKPGEDGEERGRGQEEGEEPSGGGEQDPFSEFDDGYTAWEAQNDGSGEGGEGRPSSGSGGGSGSQRPFEESFEADTDNRETPPGGGQVLQVYKPEIIPFERKNVFDGIKEDETFYHRDEGTKPIRVGRKAKAPTVDFEGDTRLRLRPGYLTPLPSVSADMQITEYTATPETKVQFSRDNGGNYWVTSDRAGIVRLQFKVTAHKWYFGGDLPKNMKWEDIDRSKLAPIPVGTQPAAERVMAHIGVSQEMPMEEAFLKLVEYYRTFADDKIPDRPDELSKYEHLTYERMGVCRHRAYGYMITANALGLPTRFITNDIHAFAETWLPGVGWKRVDLGGRELDMHVTGPSGSEPFIPPRDPFAQPPSYLENKEAGEQALRDPKRRSLFRKPRKRLSPEEFMAKYPDRCRKKRANPRRRKNKHEWAHKKGSNTAVTVALLHGDHSPSSSVYYFRENALSQYDGCQFQRTRRRDADKDMLRYFPRPDKPSEIEAPPLELRNELEMTVGEMMPRRTPVTLEGVVDATRGENPDPGRFNRVINTTHQVLEVPFKELMGRDVGGAAWSNSLMRHYLRKPLDPRYEELAEKIVNDSLPKEKQGDPLRQAAAIMVELEKTSVYDTSRSYADENTEDPVAAFLFGDRHGHALHLAHATALLLRARGLPTRLVEGYASPESNRRGGTAIMLREADAHVWAEVYVRGVGWVPVDPAPQQSVSEGVAPPDPELQRMLGEMLRGQYEGKDDDDRVSASKALGSIGSQIMNLIGMLVAFALMLILPITVSVKTWRRLAPAWASPRNLDAAVLRASLDRLAEGGIVRDFGETREAFAERLEADVPALGGLTRLHMRAFLGGDPTPASKDELKELNKAVAKQTRAATPLWKRFIGFFNPVTLWRAR